MRAGFLRDKITIQLATISRDDLGEEIKLYSDIQTIPADVMPMGTKEKYFDSGVHELADKKVAIRYRSDVDLKTRVIFGTIPYNIIDIVNVDNRSKELVFAMQEVKNG